MLDLLHVVRFFDDTQSISLLLSRLYQPSKALKNHLRQIDETIDDNRMRCEAW